MTDPRPPPTRLAGDSRFALHMAESVLTVWVHHRDLGLHEATWEQLGQYEVDERVDISGLGRLIKEDEHVWYVVDRLEDIELRGEYPKIAP